MNINLEYYKIFYYVARQGSVTAAAAELSVSQPAVSQAIKALEHAVGIPLFVRTGKGVRLTPAGEILYSYVQNGYETILRGEKKLREMKGLESGELRIGASDMTLRFFLLPYLQRFHEAYPKIKLTVTNGPTPETLRYMQEGRIDFGVVTSPVTGHEEVSVFPVRPIRDTFVAGYKFWEYKNRIIPLKELADVPLICLEKNTPVYGPVFKGERRSRPPGDRACHQRYDRPVCETESRRGLGGLRFRPGGPGERRALRTQDPEKNSRALHLYRPGKPCDLILGGPEAD